ncbi:MAG: integrase core domain-containing protein [Rubrivivax sp.]|nr:integrase core domain-containing protein [Rubrivivax sp.]
MHRTLKAEATKPPGANAAAQQRKFNVFRQEYNEVRPHEALEMSTPTCGCFTVPSSTNSCRR